MTACKSRTDNTVSETSSIIYQDDDPPATTQKKIVETIPAQATEPPTEHVSPKESFTIHSGTQKAVSGAVLNHETNKNYPLPLSDFIADGDSIQSFVFEFEASANIGTYQGGCGISVTEDCAAATNEYWYQSADFTASADGHYVKVTWNLPEEIQEYINASGTVQIGYWWGDTENVELKYVTCNYTRSVTLPVDDTAEISVDASLNYNQEENKSVKIPLSEILDDGYTPQVIQFNISADAPLGKINAGFGIQTSNDWYQSETVSQFTNDSSLSLTWLIPEKIKKQVPKNAELEFDYFWSECSNIQLNSVSVSYSYGSEGRLDPNRLPDDAEIHVIHQSDDARNIVENIKVGWNLGNTLDCYNVTWTVPEFETAWNNPKTTKQMIDSVKAVGFNAIRIPVSWSDHIDEEGNINTTWLNRVQQVVDYAMDNGLYTILNMHHDDYTWLNPTYEDEEAVTQKYVKIWSQIAERFQNYDTKLLFEGLNEPRVVGSPSEWTGGTPEEHDVINHLLQKFVDTVRASGGNNELRTLIITTHAASITENAINGLVMPDDNNLIISIHNYAPWKFTNSEFPKETAFDDAAKAELDQQFDYLYDTFVSQGVPVIIGEFGAENKNNLKDRAAYYEYYISAAAERGIPCFVWDNNVTNGTGSYGLYDRENDDWYFPDIIQSIQEAIS